MVEDADYVYVLDCGRVAEQGTVAELQAARGWFAAFARSARGAADPPVASQGVPDSP